MNLKFLENNTTELADLQGIARHEVLAALGKLKVVGATLAEAVDFFLPFGRGSVTRAQVEAFLHSKKDWSSRTIKTHHD